MNNKTKFSLFAPTLSEVNLLGCFSDWKPMAMKKQEDGYFILDVALADGKYDYKFEVLSKSWFFEEGKKVIVSDPYGIEVDENSKNTTIKVVNGKIISDEYKWQYDHIPLCPNNELIIYELHVSDFSGGEADEKVRGKFRHIIEKLDYLQDLGITAIELMPIKEYPGVYAWGYTPLNFFSIESSYGNTLELKELVDKAHKHGIRVIVDGIYNHGHTDTPLAHIDHDYWFHHKPKEEEFSWGPQFNYEFKDPNLNIYPARKFITDNITYWINNFHLDGIRYDAVKHIENHEALQLMRDTATKVAGDKQFINIGEYFPEDPKLVVEGIMDSCWQDQFFWRISNKLFNDGSFSLSEIEEIIDPQKRGFTDCTQTVNYVSNHDHSRPLPQLGEKGVFDEEAFGRNHLAATLLFTAVGIPMIWMGEEFGEYKNKSLDPAKIDWTLLANERNRNLFNHYKRLIELRKKNEALTGNHINFFQKDEGSGVLAFVRWTDSGKRVVVIANLSGTPHYDYVVNGFPCSGTWQDWIADVPIEVSNDTLVTTLGSFEGKVFVWW
jgi:1,4-alpha-glucan branching enzyme